MFSFGRAEGFSFSLDVLYEGLGISKMQFLIKKDTTCFSAVFVSILFVNTLDPDPESIEILDPSVMNPDPQHCTPLYLSFYFPIEVSTSHLN